MASEPWKYSRTQFRPLRSDVTRNPTVVIYSPVTWDVDRPLPLGSDEGQESTHPSWLQTLCACLPTPSGNPGRAPGNTRSRDQSASLQSRLRWALGAPPGGRMQRVLGRHVDLPVVDVAQHGLEGLSAGHHLPDGDVHLAVLWHEGPEHGLKVAADRGGGFLARSKCRHLLALQQMQACLAPPPHTTPSTHLERAARMALWAGLGCPSSSRVMSQNSAPAPSRYAFMSWIRDVPGGEPQG